MYAHACESPRRHRVEAAGHALSVGPLPRLAGNPHGNRHRTRHLLNQEFMQALLLNFRHEGKRAIEKVALNQPAPLPQRLGPAEVPREHKVEHSNSLRALTDEQLEAMIEYLTTSLEAQAGGSISLIGRVELEPEARTVGTPQTEERRRQTGGRQGQSARG